MGLLSLPSGRKKMRTIRASELASFLYCERAWDYARRGLQPSNRQALESGSLAHQRHGFASFLSSLLRVLAFILLAAAALLLALHFLPGL
jgi:hypothetical protein